MEKQYQTINGTSYDVRTSKEVIAILETVKTNKTRIVVDYGDVETGRSWKEEFDIAGRIGRSTGSIKIPLLVHNARSMGGGALLDHCIIKISESKGKKVLYQNSKYYRD